MTGTAQGKLVAIDDSILSYSEGDKPFAANSDNRLRVLALLSNTLSVNLVLFDNIVHKTQPLKV